MYSHPPGLSIPKQQILFSGHLDGVSTVRREDDLVTTDQGHADALPILVHATGSDRNHNTLIDGFLCLFWDQNTRGGFLSMWAGVIVVIGASVGVDSLVRLCMDPGSR